MNALSFHSDILSRALYAEGAGIARAIPSGVIVARRADDVVRALQWARDRGEELWDRVPTEEIVEEVGDYLANARDAINDAVQQELRDLRKAVKRRRKALGI